MELEGAFGKGVLGRSVTNKDAAVPTLVELRKHSSWVWVWCERSQHHAPMAYMPLMIRWGANVSSDS